MLARKQRRAGEQHGAPGYEGDAGSGADEPPSGIDVLVE
jgi:hypothetical protein